ncbi:MAG: hypothetical protein WDO18_20305 [Acidobacteriota bacterium]
MRLLSSLLPLLLLSTASAQQAFTPAVRAVVGTPNPILYGFGLKSSDNGRTWTPLYLTEPGLPQPAFTAIEIDPSNPQFLYVTTSAADGTFWKSTDAGASWHKSSTGLPDGTTPDALRQTASPHALYIRSGTRLYKSSNKGDSWTQLGTLPGTNPVWEMSLSQPNRMYAADRESDRLATLNIYTTSDEGRTWSYIGKPNTALTTSRGITGLGVLFSNPNTVFASVSGCCELLPGPGAGTYVSTDGGQSYSFLRGAIGDFTRMFSPPGPNLYALSATAGGYSFSTNEGVSWGNGFTFPASDSSASPPPIPTRPTLRGEPASQPDSCDPPIPARIGPKSPPPSPRPSPNVRSFRSSSKKVNRQPANSSHRSSKTPRGLFPPQSRLRFVSQLRMTLLGSPSPAAPATRP